MRSDLRGYASEAAKVLQTKEKVVDRKALGWLVQNFFNTVYSNHSSNDRPADERDDAWMSISLRIESSGVSQNLNSSNQSSNLVE